MRKLFAYLIPLVLVLAVGALGAYIQGEALEEWYPNLLKSPYTPPAVVFPTPPFPLVITILLAMPLYSVF